MRMPCAIMMIPLLPAIFATPSLAADPATPPAVVTTDSQPAAPAATVPAPATMVPPPVQAPQAAPVAPASTASAQPSAPASAMAGEIGQRLSGLPSQVPAAERGAVTEFYAVRSNEPVWVSPAALNAKGAALAAELRKADEWGLRASDFDVPALPQSASSAQLADAEIRLTLAALKYGRHARGGRFDPADLSYSLDRKPTFVEPRVLLDGLAAAGEPDAYLRGLHPQHPQFAKLRAQYLALRAGAVAVPVEPAPAPEAGQKSKGRKQQQSKAVEPPSARSAAQRVLLNMEAWRWMPEDMGDVHVWVNIPEFTLRVVKAGKVIHSERIIAGLVDKQTPIFSEKMATIVFHPFWGVPDSIKVREILPSLARGGNVLAKNGLRIQSGGRDIDPSSVDWSSTDIRRFHVYQPPGGANVLGVVKFLFPNKHDVYMHDTPTKHLFAAEQRTFSHGCMRVRNPLQLAELILAEDKGWTKDQVQKLAAPGATGNNQIQLTNRIPVHITYFTAMVGDDDKLVLKPDVYGYEPKIQMGLDGKASLIVKKKDNLQAEVIARLSEARATRSAYPDWFKSIFGF